MHILFSVLCLVLFPVSEMKVYSKPDGAMDFLSIQGKTQFRGPSGQGHYEGSDFPVRWSVSESIHWKTELPGKAWSSPIWIKDSNSLILTNALEEEGELSLEVLSLDLGSGRRNWVRPLFKYRESPQIHRKNSHASPTP